MEINHWIWFKFGLFFRSNHFTYLILNLKKKLNELIQNSKSPIQLIIFQTRKLLIFIFSWFVWFELEKYIFVADFMSFIILTKWNFSILSVVGKIYAAILEKRTRSIVERFLNENQFGFRPMRGCQDQIFVMGWLMGKFHETNKDMNLCFVDLQKANDSVSKSKLWIVFSYYY